MLDTNPTVGQELKTTKRFLWLLLTEYGPLQFDRLTLQQLGDKECEIQIIEDPSGLITMEAMP